MRRSSIFGVSALLAFSSSAALALVMHEEWSGKVMGKDGSAIHGSATMKAGKKANTTDVMVKLSGDVAAGARPWHVHSGSCAKAGGVFGGGASYTAVAMNAKGAGKSKATLPVTVPDTGMYYVNIHESATMMAKIVACGDLKKAK